MKNSILAACLVLCALSANWQAQARVTKFDKTSNSSEEKPPQAHVIEYAPVSVQGGSKNYTPVLFWHGMGDTAYGSINIDRLALQRKFPGMKVFSVQIGDSIVEDEMAGYFSNVNEQIEQVCSELLRNEVFKRAKALNAVGFSQGSQFLRGLVERCPLRQNGIRVKNLITLGGQHQGVFGLPRCASSKFCDYIRFMLNTGAYRDYVQHHVVQAQYWHDSLNEADYKTKNIFLPDINNENYLNPRYRDNLLALDNLVLVKFLQDEMVVPRESSQFEFYEPGQNSRIMPLEDSQIYKEDRLGLKRLAESGRLKLVNIPGRHLQYKMSWFLNQIAAQYLDN